jgi:hypothetical protein
MSANRREKKDETDNKGTQDYRNDQCGGIADMFLKFPVNGGDREASAHKKRDAQKSYKQ